MQWTTKEAGIKSATNSSPKYTPIPFVSLYELQVLGSLKTPCFAFTRGKTEPMYTWKQTITKIICLYIYFVCTIDSNTVFVVTETLVEILDCWE